MYKHSSEYQNCSYLAAGNSASTLRLFWLQSQLLYLADQSDVYYLLLQTLSCIECHLYLPSIEIAKVAKCGALMIFFLLALRLAVASVQSETGWSLRKGGTKSQYPTIVSAIGLLYSIHTYIYREASWIKSEIVVNQFSFLHFIWICLYLSLHLNWFLRALAAHVRTPRWRF